MKKIKLDAVVKELFNVALTNYTESMTGYGFTQEEKVEEIERFKKDWSEIETVEELIEVLMTYGYHENEAVDLILQTVIDEE